MFHSRHEGHDCLECAVCGYRSGHLSYEAAIAGHGVASCPRCVAWCQRAVTALEHAEASGSGAFYALKAYVEITLPPSRKTPPDTAPPWERFMGYLKEAKNIAACRIRLDVWRDTHPALADMIPGLPTDFP